MSATFDETMRMIVVAIAILLIVLSIGGFIYGFVIKRDSSSDKKLTY